MDGNRFDELTRVLGSGRSRRSVFKALGAAALGAIGFDRFGGSASAGGGNSACAQWCHANFSGSAAGQCTSDAAHGTGACYGCGPAAPAGSTAQLCGGVCIPACPTPDQCHTQGACNPATQSCTNPAKANGAACDDGNACTQTDTCQAGVCTGGNPVVCAPADQCHQPGVCNSMTGACSYDDKPDKTPCNTANKCRTGDVCTAGVCGGGSDVVCDSKNGCVVDSCDPAVGCVHANKPAGAQCDDGNACTQTDACDGNGTCVGNNPVVCHPPDQCHGPGMCDPTTGTCSNPPLKDGTPCNDGNACTQTDTCQAGVCTGSNPVICKQLDQCHQPGMCDPASGVCSNPNKPEGTICNDGDACTTGDACFSGACKGNLVSCTAPNANEVCSPATGKCVVASCASGFADCNNDPADGCETNTANDPRNCGACGNVCGAANGTPTCTGSVCKITCNPGFANCDGNPANGCEVNTANDPNNCGGCGNVCPMPANGRAICASGTCQIICNGGYTLCNGACVNEQTDVNNCGACNHVCPHGEPCVSGVCQPTCSDGIQNGSETDVDCGGGACPRCANGKKCLVNNDCASNACDAVTLTCVASQCADHRQDGSETDVDCGGGVCPTCANGKKCLVNGDCTSGHCANGTCFACGPNEVAFQGHCYYLDGSGGVCDAGYSLAPESVLAQINTQFIGLNYKHNVSHNCCIWTSDPTENFGMLDHCNAPGPFDATDVKPGDAGCTNAVNHLPGQLTFCGSN